MCTFVSWTDLAPWLEDPVFCVSKPAKTCFAASVVEFCSGTSCTEQASQSLSEDYVEVHLRSGLTWGVSDYWGWEAVDEYQIQFCSQVWIWKVCECMASVVELIGNLKGRSAAFKTWHGDESWKKVWPEKVKIFFDSPQGIRLSPISSQAHPLWFMWIVSCSWEYPIKRVCLTPLSHTSFCEFLLLLTAHKCEASVSCNLWFWNVLNHDTMSQFQVCEDSSNLVSCSTRGIFPCHCSTVL